MIRIWLFVCFTLGTTLTMRAEEEKEILFVRHAESEFNTFRFKKILYGLDSIFGLNVMKKDVDLTEKGVIDSLLLKNNQILQEAVLDADTVVMASTLVRSIHTAIFALANSEGHLPKKLHVHQSLQEVGVLWGETEYVVPDSIPETPANAFPSLRAGVPGYSFLTKTYANIQDHLQIYPYDAGDFFDQKLSSFSRFIFDSQVANKRVIVFGHSNWLREFFRFLDPSSPYAQQKIPNCALLRFKLHRSDDGILQLKDAQDPI